MCGESWMKERRKRSKTKRVNRAVGVAGGGVNKLYWRKRERRRRGSTGKKGTGNEEEKHEEEEKEEEALSCGTAGRLARERRSVLSNRRPEIITPGWWRIESSSLRNRRSRGHGKTHVYLSAEAPPTPPSQQPPMVVVRISRRITRS